MIVIEAEEDLSIKSFKTVYQKLIEKVSKDFDIFKDVSKHFKDSTSCVIRLNSYQDKAEANNKRIYPFIERIGKDISKKVKTCIENQMKRYSELFQESQGIIEAYNSFVG